MSTLTLPVKRGTFVEFRTGLINICPVGRSCSQKEREQFAEYDQVHCVREKFIQAITKQFPNLPFKYSIGKPRRRIYLKRALYCLSVLFFNLYN